MAHEIVFRKLVKGFEFPFQTLGDGAVHPRFAGENPQHDRRVPPRLHGTAQNAGIAFVQDVEDAVIIDGLPPLADHTPAGGAGGYFFRQKLAALLTYFHETLPVSCEWNNAGQGRNQRQDTVGGGPCQSAAFPGSSRRIATILRVPG